MPLSCGNLPAQRNKMESLADTSQSECREMQTTGKGVTLMSFLKLYRSSAGNLLLPTL